MHEKESTLEQDKGAIKFLQKQNEELNKRLGEMQQKMVKSVEILEFRHQRFNELQKSINEILKTGPQNQETAKIKKTWEELTEYTKTRDKKIKAMEDMIKRK